MNPMMNIIIKAARKAGDVITRHFDRLDRINVSQKRPKDFVSDVDRQAEQEIIAILKKTYPEHKIITEESGEIAGDKDNVWIIDPLDGTKNYVHGFPHCAVSIAFQYRGKIQHGVIYDPFRQEIFSASRGEGARLNDRRLRVSQESKFENAFIATGFPVREPQLMPAFLQTLTTLIPRVLDVRCSGSAALDLAYVAAGRIDGYWEVHLKAWDIAAGALLIQEAGGITKDIYGNEDYLNSGKIVAGNFKIFPSLLQHIQVFEKQF